MKNRTLLLMADGGTELQLVGLVGIIRKVFPKYVTMYSYSVQVQEVKLPRCLEMDGWISMYLGFE